VRLKARSECGDAVRFFLEVRVERAIAIDDVATGPLEFEERQQCIAQGLARVGLERNDDERI